MVREQKTDERDARPLLDLLLTKRFPRVWVRSPEEGDARQLLQHRQKLVRMRTAVKNRRRGLAMGHGLCRQQKRWSARGRQQREALEPGPWASRRRQELLPLLDGLDPQIAELNAAGEAEAARRAEVRRRREQKGVGPGVGLAFVLTLGPVSWCPRSRQVVSYLGRNPREDTTSLHQRFGHLSKQGDARIRKCALRTRTPRAHHGVPPTCNRACRVPHGPARPDSAIVGWAPSRPAAAGLPVPRWRTRPGSQPKLVFP